MHWRDDPYWRYEDFPFDTPAAEFGVFEHVVEMWREKAGPDRLAPDWRDVTLHDLTGWWGWVYVLDRFHPTDPTFRVRLWGSKLADVLGYEITGTVLKVDTAAEAADARDITKNDLIFARHLLDEGLIGRGSGPLNVDHGKHINYFEIMLPMSADGRTFDKILNFCWIDHPAIPR